MSSKTCTVEGCGRAHVARGWCNAHYLRWLRRGDPCIDEAVCDTARITGTPQEQFWAKVAVSDGCWTWTAATDRDGYGKFTDHSNGRRMHAHRFAYELLVGEVPEGLELDHLCRNRACVRPDHLEPVTHLENVRRSRAMLQAREVTPNDGPIVVVCDNPQHRAGGVNRFPTMSLAESFLLGNAIFGDCLHAHRVFDWSEQPQAMRDLGELLASLMPAEDDEDSCGMSLGG